MLTNGMGVTPPTLYAAFGSKEELYLEALGHYLEREQARVPGLVREAGSAFQKVERFLRAAAVEFTQPGQPRGCMVSTGSLQCAVDNQPVADAAASLRAESFAAFVARVEQGKLDGELPSTTDAHALARFYAAVVQGLSVQAIDGASRATLDAVVDVALGAWPGRPGPTQDVRLAVRTVEAVIA